MYRLLPHYTFENTFPDFSIIIILPKWNFISLSNPYLLCPAILIGFQLTL